MIEQRDVSPDRRGAKRKLQRVCERREEGGVEGAGDGEKSSGRLKRHRRCLWLEERQKMPFRSAEVWLFLKIAGVWFDKRILGFIILLKKESNL